MLELTEYDAKLKIEIDTAGQDKDESGPELNLDSVLVGQVGPFGRHQRRLVLWLAVVAVLTAWCMNDYVFTAARINHRCLIPECDGENPEFAASWVKYAVPVEDSCCRRRAAPPAARAARCSPQSFLNDTQPCDRFVYETTHTVVYDYDLGCDEWTRSMIGSIQTMGNLLSLPINGYMSDRWGRRTMLVACSFGAALVGVARYWANTFTTFLSSIVVEAVVGTGYNSGYILLMELVGPKYRVVAGAAMNSFFSIGQMLLGIIAWMVPNWRNLTLTLYIPQLVTIAYIWIIPESPRWYMAKGRFKEAEIVLKDVAITNGRHLSDDSLQSLRITLSLIKRSENLGKRDGDGNPWIIYEIFQHKSILVRCLVTPTWWVSFTLVYYGLSINAVNLSGNQYLNYVIVTAMEVPGFWIAVWLMNRVGRKPVLIGAYCICAACQIGYIFTPKEMAVVSLVLYLVGKGSIAGAVMAVFVFTAELYPTHRRHTLFSYSSMVGRLGAILAPLTPALGAAYWDQLPFAMFAACCLASAALTLLVPETLGARLPETMEEASALNKRQM